MSVGLPGKKFHDGRRTVARNLIRSRVPESIALKITGYKTPSVFQQYKIVVEADLWDATKKVSQYKENQKEKGKIASISRLGLESYRTILAQYGPDRTKPIS